MITNYYEYVRTWYDNFGSVFAPQNSPTHKNRKVTFSFSFNTLVTKGKAVKGKKVKKIKDQKCSNAKNINIKLYYQYFKELEKD